MTNAEMKSLIEEQAAQIAELITRVQALEARPAAKVYPHRKPSVDLSEVYARIDELKLKLKAGEIDGPTFANTANGWIAAAKKAA